MPNVTLSLDRDNQKGPATVVRRVSSSPRADRRPIAMNSYGYSADDPRFWL